MGTSPAAPSLDREPVPGPSALHVEVRQLCVAFGARTVFSRLSCSFPREAVSVVLGQSGVGKSVLLRILARLQDPDSGEVLVDREPITRMSAVQADRYRRSVGMMFQGGALLDSMTVFENLALPLREHTRMPAREIRDRVHAQLEAVGLREVDPLLPGALSGGMKKRVALARALIRTPELLLIDEPFSGLDPVAVRMIEALLVEVAERSKATMILTSHHIPSALRMADHLVYLVGGGAISGTPADLRRSADPRVRAFLDADLGS